MNFQEEYSNITDSEEFKELEKEFPEIFLSSIFLDTTGWQFNFYYTHKLITFVLENGIIKTEESEVSEKDKEFEELNIKEIKIELEQVKELTEKLTEEEITKKIIILQQKQVPFWNLTYITSSLNVLNIKINAISGEIMEQTTENIMKFKGAQ
jgi:hypothetical protein